MTRAIDGAANEDAAARRRRGGGHAVGRRWSPPCGPSPAQLEGKVVVSVANALVKQGREMHALVPPRGSMAAAVQAALPGALVAAAGHHLPASELEDLDAGLGADVLVCSDHPEATAATMALLGLDRRACGPSMPGAWPRRRPSRPSPPCSSR